MTTFPDRVDVRRRAGWLPPDHDGWEGLAAAQSQRAAGVGLLGVGERQLDDMSTRSPAATGRSDDVDGSDDPSGER